MTFPTRPDTMNAFRIIRWFLSSLLLLGVSSLPLHAIEPGTEWDRTFNQAETFRQEKSYAKALDLLVTLSTNHVAPARLRQLQLRIADCQWRSQPNPNPARPQDIGNARFTLEALSDESIPQTERDPLWLQARESLADSWWAGSPSPDWGNAWPHFSRLLETYAASTQIESARNNYLRVTWKIAEVPNPRGFHYQIGGSLNGVPLDILVNAHSLATLPIDKARAAFYLAMQLARGMDAANNTLRYRTQDFFDEAIKPGRQAPWLDQALAGCGEWWMQSGAWTMNTDGSTQQQPDLRRALDYFRRFETEFKKGDSPHWDRVQQQITELTRVEARASVDQFFLPGSQIQIALGWRNATRIDLALHPIDLTTIVPREDGSNWIEGADLSKSDAAIRWSHDTKDTGDHRQGQALEPIEATLKTGAHLLLSSTPGSATHRDLILVTDLTLLLKTDQDKALVFVCNALDSTPATNATVTVTERWRADNRWYVDRHTATTGSDGTALLKLGHHANGVQLIAAARIGDRQAFAITQTYFNPPDRSQPWRIQAYTERAAYRPGETVQFKLIARTLSGDTYATPAGKRLQLEILDPRSTRLLTNEVTLNAYGAAWGSLTLGTNATLGECQITFRSADLPSQLVGNATLFRVEEYKLPEFKVTVSTSNPTTNQPPSNPRPGDPLEASIQADYYFGGPVAGATVQVVIRRLNGFSSLPMPREFPWLYQDPDGNPWRRPRWRNEGEIVLQQTLTTGPDGKAIARIETSRDLNQDFEYQIEARVTDSSRREITGSGRIRVSQLPFHATLRTPHQLHAPGSAVDLTLTTRTANEQPVQTSGTLVITRDRWSEIWINPAGRELSGIDLDLERRRHPIFPPLPTPGLPPWRLKSRGYQSTEILRTDLKTTADGTAETRFTPNQEGFYRITWSHPDATPGYPPVVVHGETTIWACDRNSATLGYHAGGVELILDKDTFRSGQPTPVMISIPSPDRYVLLTVEGPSLLHHQVVHVTGQVKRIDLDVTDAWVPNVQIDAAMAADRTLHLDSKAVTIPPTRHFLNVTLTPNHAALQPRDRLTLDVQTTDDQGHNTPAELSLGLTDDAVSYIQSDYARDPREFFFANRRPRLVTTRSTLNERPLARLVKLPDGRIVEEQEKLRIDRARHLRELIGDSETDTSLLSMSEDNRVVEQLSRRGDGGSGRTRGLAINSPMPPASAMAADLGSATRGLRQETASKAAAPALSARYGLMSNQAMAKGKDAALNEADPAVVVRSDFRSTAFWKPDVTTDANGHARVTIDLPDSVTTWKAVARALTTGSQFGITATNVQTRQPLIVRLQTPRFLVAGDTVTLSAVANNNTDQPVTALVSLLLLEPGTNRTPSTALQPAGTPGRMEPRTLTLPPGGEARADWVFQARTPGVIRIQTTAQDTRHNTTDAMERTVPILEHGIEQLLTRTARSRSTTTTLSLDLPRERRPGSTRFTIQVTPNLATTLLDALPYLVDYPYGCTEQTLSRFVPAIITARTLRTLGVDPATIASQIHGGIEPAHAQATHPGGRQNFDQLTGIANAGLERLYDLQHPTGGFGWWKEDADDAFMTAYVVWSLSLASDAGLTINPATLERAVNYLDQALGAEPGPSERQAWILHGLATHHAHSRTGPGNLTANQRKAFDQLYDRRDQLNAYGRALLALSAHAFGFREASLILVRNLENGAIRDTHAQSSVLTPGSNPKTPIEPNDNTTVHWGEDGIYWRWADGGIEATAFVLRALLTIDPKNALIEPTVTWLIRNRRGAQWTNTRDTAIVILALNDHLAAARETLDDTTFDLSVNGRLLKRIEVPAARFLDAPRRFDVDPAWLKDGPNTVQIIRSRGKSPLDCTLEARFFSAADPVPAAGSQLFVRREYHRIVGTPTLLRGLTFQHVPLHDGDTIQAGDRIECTLTLEAKNHYEYLLVEDRKPAGIESVQLRSGEPLYARQIMAPTTPASTGNAGNPKTTATKDSSPSRRLQPFDPTHTGRTQWVYQELRDRHQALFLPRLAEGFWELKTQYRAETPGTFHALPAIGQAMYVPEIRGNSDEIRIRIEDKPGNP